MVSDFVKQILLSIINGLEIASWIVVGIIFYFNNGN